MTVCASGLGHSEGPYELDDGRVVYANSYASEIGAWDRDGKAGTYARSEGAERCMWPGSDGCVWIPPRSPMSAPGSLPLRSPPSIQKISPLQVDLVTGGGGVEL